MIAHLTPAYGKDYKSRKEVISSLKGGADFLLNDVGSPWYGKPINLPQLKEAGYTSFQVRYKRLTAITSVYAKDVA